MIFRNKSEGVGQQGKGLERHFAFAAGHIKNIAGQAETGRLSRNPFHHFHPLPQFNPEMISAPHGITLKEVVGSNGNPLQTIEKFAHRFVIVVDRPEQH